MCLTAPEQRERNERAANSLALLRIGVKKAGTDQWQKLPLHSRHILTLTPQQLEFLPLHTGHAQGLTHLLCKPMLHLNRFKATAHPSNQCLPPEVESWPAQQAPKERWRCHQGLDRKATARKRQAPELSPAKGLSDSVHWP